MHFSSPSLGERPVNGPKSRIFRILYLWRDLLQTKRRHHATIKKVKAHLPFSAVEEGKLTLEQWLGNCVADAAADAAAALCCPREEDATEWEKWVGMAYRICERIAFIEEQRWEALPQMAPTPTTTPTPPAPTHKEAVKRRAGKIAEQGHILIAQGSGNRCLRCLRWKAHGQANFWTDAPCAQVPEW